MLLTIHIQDGGLRGFGAGTGCGRHTDQGIGMTAGILTEQRCGKGRGEQHGLDALGCIHGAAAADGHQAVAAFALKHADAGSTLVKIRIGLEMRKDRGTVGKTGRPAV